MFKKIALLCLATNYVLGQNMIIFPKVLDLSNLNAAESYFTIKLDSPPDNDVTVKYTSKSVTFSQCQSTTFSIDNWQIEQKVYVDRQSAFSSLSVDTLLSEILLEMFNKDSNTLMKNDTIQLKNIQPSKGASCYSTGDPHFVTFNGQAYDYQSYHTVWLVQSPFLSVQCLQMPCNNFVTCNIACTVQVSDGNNFAYFIASANGTTGRLSVSNIRDDNNLLNSYLHHQTISDKNWKFLFRDGSQVSVTGNNWPTAEYGYLNVFIFVPSRYKYLTSGLCGIWDDNPNRLLLPNGTFIEYKSKSASVQNTTLFSNAWTIQNSSVAYNQIYNIINGSYANPIDFSTMYRFQPYTLETIQKLCGSALQTIIKEWNSKSFSQCMKPLSVMPTLVRPPTGLKNPVSFVINWNAIQRYTLWGRFTPRITDPDRYYPGYKFRGAFVKRELDTNTTQIVDNTTQIVDNTQTEVDDHNIYSEEELQNMENKCTLALNAENCKKIVSEDHKKHVQNCVGDLKIVWKQKDENVIAVTVNNHKLAFLEHCQHASDILLSTIPMKLAEQIDQILVQTQVVNNNTLLRRSTDDTLFLIQNIVGKDSPIINVIQAQLNNGMGIFEDKHHCLNNGIKNPSGGCECKPKYYGIHCEYKYDDDSTTSTETSTTPTETETETTPTETETETETSTETSTPTTETSTPTTKTVLNVPTNQEDNSFNNTSNAYKVDYKKSLNALLMFFLFIQFL